MRFGPATRTAPRRRSASTSTPMCVAPPTSTWGTAWCCATGWSSRACGVTRWEGFDSSFLDPHNWLWNTILFTTDYLPQGTVTPPVDTSVSVGMPASFSTSFWTAPEGESRVEWWRSDNEGATWSRVRTTIVPIALTADTYTIPATALSDNNALIRVRLCGIPRTATPNETCTDSTPVRLTVLQGVTAASFSQQPRPVLVRTGQTATFSVAVGGTPDAERALAEPARQFERRLGRRGQRQRCGDAQLHDHPAHRARQRPAAARGGHQPGGRGGQRVRHRLGERHRRAADHCLATGGPERRRRQRGRVRRGGPRHRGAELPVAPQRRGDQRCQRAGAQAGPGDAGRRHWLLRAGEQRGRQRGERCRRADGEPTAPCRRWRPASSPSRWRWW